MRNEDFFWTAIPSVQAAILGLSQALSCSELIGGSMLMIFHPEKMEQH